MKTWPQNVGNHISEDLIFKNFRGGMPPDPPTGDRLRRSKKRTPLCKILDPPQESSDIFKVAIKKIAELQSIEGCYFRNFTAKVRKRAE